MLNPRLRQVHPWVKVSPSMGCFPLPSEKHFSQIGKKIFPGLVFFWPPPTPQKERKSNVSKPAFPPWGIEGVFHIKKMHRSSQGKGAMHYLILYMPVGLTNELFHVHTFQISCKVTTYFRDNKEKAGEVSLKKTNYFICRLLMRKNKKGCIG